MKPVTIYTTTYCPYCDLAKGLLEKKGAPFTEVNLDEKPELRNEVIQRSGRRTVPQIWIGDVHVGGYDDLALLEREGRLDGLLA